MWRREIPNNNSYDFFQTILPFSLLRNNGNYIECFWESCLLADKDNLANLDMSKKKKKKQKNYRISLDYEISFSLVAILSSDLFILND